MAETIFTHMQKEIENDDFQTNSVWTKYGKQENKDFRKDMGFLEMKDAFKETASRTQVKLYWLKKKKEVCFCILQNCLRCKILWK